MGAHLLLVACGHLWAEKSRVVRSLAGRRPQEPTSRTETFRKQVTDIKVFRKQIADYKASCELKKALSKLSNSF